MHNEIYIAGSHFIFWPPSWIPVKVELVSRGFFEAICMAYLSWKLHAGIINWNILAIYWMSLLHYYHYSSFLLFTRYKLNYSCLKTACYSSRFFILVPGFRMASYVSLTSRLTNLSYKSVAVIKPATYLRAQIQYFASIHYYTLGI